MAFSFGAKPAATGFGGFGTTSTAPAATGFGGFGSTAAAAPAATGFGGFGTNTSAPAAATGFGGFGTTAAAAPAATGFGGFGSTSAAPAFGSTSTAPAFGGFGAKTTTSAFGTPATQAGTGFGGFGATTQAAGTGFGGFGSTATSQTNTGFGGFGTAAKPATGFGGFGSTASQPASSTGFGGFGGFGSTNTAGTTGGLFGGGATNTGGGGLFGQQQQQQQQQQQKQNPVDELFNSVLHCSLFGDERDGIIARWNMLQASWGTGKAYYSNSCPPITILPENPFCRFRAIGYSAMPKQDDKDGLVSLVFKKKAAEIEAGKAGLITSLSGVLGNKPNLKVTVQDIKSTGPESSDVSVFVVESGQNGATNKITASALNTFFNQTAQAQSLKNLGVEMVIPKLAFTDSDLKSYLETAPAGVDPRLWKQAQLDNPDSKRFIPVPIIGFKALQQRIKVQEDQAKSHQGRLDCIAEDISQLQKKHQNTLTALAEKKRKQLELSHRVLKVLVYQESTRKQGFTITQEEEQLRSHLESIQGELETPTQFKGRLNELLSQVQLQAQSSVMSGQEKYTLDQFAVTDIKAILREQQEAIQALVQVVKEDLKDLNVIVEGLTTEQS